MNNSSVSVTENTGTGITISFVLYATFLIIPNTLAFISLRKTKSIPRKIKLPIMNLILSDLLTGLSFISYIILRVSDLPRNIQRSLCYVQLIWTLTTAFVSFSIVGGLVIDRCICLYFEYVYLTKVTVKVILVWQVITWMISFLFATLIFVDTNWESDCLYRYIVGKYGRNIHMYYSIFFRVISAIAFVSICIKIKKMRNAHCWKGINRRGIFQMTSKILVIGLTFHGMYFPLFCHHVFVLIYPDKYNDIHEFYTVASMLVILNNCVNPFIYAWRFPECRMQLKMMMCFWDKTTVENENIKRKQILVSFLDPPRYSGRMDTAP